MLASHPRGVYISVPLLQNIYRKEPFNPMAIFIYSFISYLIFLAIAVTFILIKKNRKTFLLYLIPANVVIITAIIIITILITGYYKNPFVCVLFVVALAICASAGAYVHNPKTYVFGIIAAVIFPILGMKAPLYVASILFAVISSIFLLILCVLGLFFDKTARQKSPANSDISTPPPALSQKNVSVSAKTPCEHSIVCISGTFAGSEFALKEKEAINIGSNPSQSQLILSGTSIADRHCKVWFDQAVSCWCVANFSADATYQNETKQLKKDFIYKIAPGSILSIGNGPDKHKFKLL